jgi:hypothetical protein
MLIVDYLRWWYGIGWKDLGLFFVGRISRTSKDFSVSILLKTLLKPWRQTIETGQRSLGDRLRAAIGNAVSRGVGASVRIGALLVACLLIIGECILAAVFLIGWPLLPVSGFGLIAWGLI